MQLGVGLLGAVATVGVVLGSCADLSPVQNDLKDLHAQVRRMSSDVAAMKSSLDGASQAARQAQQA